MPSLSRHDHIIIDLSLQVLRAAMERSVSETIATIEVRLALRCLLPHCREDWPLHQFWEATGTVHAQSRSAMVIASFNGIVKQLRAGGWSEQG